MKNYVMRFGSGDPRTLTGLSPTFLIFVRSDTGATLSPPSITEIAANWGLYTFQWGTTTPIAFLADAATTSPGTSGRYVSGSIDPADRADEYGNTLVAIGNSNIALGTSSVALGTTSVAIGNSVLASIPTGLGTTIVAMASLIGGAGSTFGGTSPGSDPIDLFGYLKRIQENLEGNSTFTKSSGSWQIYSRGSSTLLITKTVANGVSTVTKT